MSNYISDAEVELLLHQSKERLHSMKCLDIGNKERLERLELLQEIVTLERHLREIKTYNPREIMLSCMKQRDDD